MQTNKKEEVIVGILAMLAFRYLTQYAKKNIDKNSKHYFYYQYIKCLTHYVLLPLVYLQGKEVYKNTPMLPPPSDSTYGYLKTKSNNKTGKKFSILFVGESPIAGIGISTFKHGLPRQTALFLQKKKSFEGIDIEYDSSGVNGATIQDTLKNQVPQINAANYNAIVIQSAVNDTKGLTSIYICNSPPLHKFQNMPNPLRYMMGCRAKLLNSSIQILSNEMGDQVQYTPAQFEYKRELFCEDHFHPSHQGNIEWGKQLAKYIEPKHLFQIENIKNVTDSQIQLL